MNLRPHICYLLSVLRVHNPDCKHCNEMCGYEMRQRLEELNGRTQTHSLNNGDHKDVVRVFDSKPGEVVATPPISVKAQQKKVG